MYQRLFFLSVCLFVFVGVRSQGTYHEIAGDTIVTLPGFLGNTYLLGGKKMSLPVMEWFMAGHPESYENIRLARLGDQLSVSGYSVGGLFALTGLLIFKDEELLGKELLAIGGIGIGAGLVFQLISGGFKKRAVRSYNEEIKAYYKRKQSLFIKAGITDDGFGLRLGFD